MDVFVPALVLVATVKALIDLVRRIQAGGQGKAVVLQVAAWAAGVLVVVLFAQTDWADGITLAGQSLSKMGFWAQVIVGLTVGSTAMLANDTLKAVDNTQTANPTPPPPAS